ncbi:MAG: DUF1801 domain-containing protein [Bacteroidetes bacterium]|nr:DUF1801 domain-containing protein [Bacteroidota bacterium]
MAEKKAVKPKKVELKTKETNDSVEAFINSVPDEQKRKDSFAIVEMMKKATGDKPKMWGSAIIGFGNVVVTSPNTGRELDWMKIGFSPRKANISLYIGIGSDDQQASLQKLGKHKTGKGCLYINKLEDVDVKVLQTMITTAAKRKKG